MKNLDYALLFEIYGKMLTDKQQSVMELYYWEDLSLGEIAQGEGITRQAVRDSIKRSEQLLEEFEKKLMLAEKIRSCRRNCNTICSCVQSLKDDISAGNDCIDKIYRLASETGDLF